jgi:hypothetical protein
MSNETGDVIFDCFKFGDASTLWPGKSCVAARYVFAFVKR